jgi:hypothetical protein
LIRFSSLIDSRAQKLKGTFKKDENILKKIEQRRGNGLSRPVLPDLRGIPAAGIPDNADGRGGARWSWFSPERLLSW